MEVLFAKRLKELRKERNLTQTEVGEYLGYGYTAITNYESGRNRPSYEDLIKLCVLFHVSTDYLIGYSDTRKQQEIEKQLGDGGQLLYIESGVVHEIECGAASRGLSSFSLQTAQ